MLEQRILYSSLLSSFICLAMMYYLLMIQWLNPVTGSHSHLNDSPGYVSWKGHTVPQEGPLSMQYMQANDHYALCHLARVTNVY